MYFLTGPMYISELRGVVALPWIMTVLEAELVLMHHHFLVTEWKCTKDFRWRV
jgi:hypothetical protein